jgi:hypothetical protein
MASAHILDERACMTGNRTWRYLRGRSEKRGYNGEEFVPRSLLTDPTFVKRLSYRMFASNAEGREHLADDIAEVAPEVSFFLDTNIWGRNLEDTVWLSLLGRRDSVYVIPSVRLELQGWISRNSGYIGSRAILEKNPNLIVQGLPPTESDEMTAYMYYAYLLQSRRRAFHIYGVQFREEEGRDPSPEELMVGVQRTFGERGLALAHKDGRPIALDKWATDESLVYLAAAHALETGRPTVVLTKDQDVLEQFYKLWWFLDTHYRAMLMAEYYARNRFAFPIESFPSVRHARKLFDLRNGLLVNMGPQRMNAVLPREPTFVSVECWLVGKEMTRLTFGAETGMYRLLKIKGATGGLVSDQLEGRNLHPWLAPLPLGDKIADCVGVVYDRTVEAAGSRARVGMFDITHAVNNHERFSSLRADPGLSETGLWTPGVSATSSEMGLLTSTKPQSRSKTGLWLPPSRPSR